VLRSLLLATLFAGCGSHPHAGLAAPAMRSVPGAELAIGPPLVTPGEHMTYRLELRGIELASYELGASDVVDLAGKKAIVVSAHAKTVGLGALVHVDDYFSSWIDVTTGRPLRWASDEYAVDGDHKEKSDCDFTARTADALPMTFHLDDRPPNPEPQRTSLRDAWDYNAFLVALRSWEGPPGTRITAEVLRSRYMWHVDMTIHGKETLQTELGELPALRLDGHTYKLLRDGRRDPDSDPRDFSLWISDDDGRVPLQIVAKTDYGDIKMRIVDYQPGTGQPLRN